MENYQNQYGATRRTTGEYGSHTDPVVGQQVDEYGNPIINPSAAPGYGAAGTTTGVGLHHGKEGHHGIAGKLHRSGGSSSSSSSSEDDGYGGRRKKKGLKQKIKEKIPGVHSGEHDHPQATSTTTPGGYHSADEPHHKKGVMEKIKDKVTGTHHNY
ncbi:unnamed protein product [Linum trigynum]|uniref:Dehydrin n=1 Tax=Linum trigynum TaxID=586398 RepID=A0AAV2DIQ3_9ROSI